MEALIKTTVAQIFYIQNFEQGPMILKRIRRDQEFLRFKEIQSRKESFVTMIIVISFSLNRSLKSAGKEK